MKRQRGFTELACVVLTACAMTGIILAIATWVASYGCRSRWDGSGIQTRYDIPGGCKVQRKDGTWLPEKAVRDVSLGG